MKSPKHEWHHTEDTKTASSTKRAAATRSFQYIPWSQRSRSAREADMHCRLRHPPMGTPRVWYAVLPNIILLFSPADATARSKAAASYDTHPRRQSRGPGTNTGRGPRRTERYEVPFLVANTPNNSATTAGSRRTSALSKAWPASQTSAQTAGFWQPHRSQQGCAGRMWSIACASSLRADAISQTSQLVPPK